MASLVEQRFVEEILTSEGARLLKNQGAAFAARLHFHTKRILEHRRTEVSAADGYSGKLAVSHTAYQRFLDLQKAESQTRETQVQLSLERVRARTMAIVKVISLS